MPDIIIYTTPVCPYCERAKKLLERKGLSYREIDVMTDTKARQDMVSKTKGRTSVPQIFINDQHSGGSDELYALERDGKLEALLK